MKRPKGTRSEKQSLYLGDKIAAEVEQESHRLERSSSWLMQRAWAIAKSKIRELSSTPEASPIDKSGRAA